MNRFIIICISLALYPAFSYGQTAQDALRYSRIYPGGTARFMALGGATGALGADFTSTIVNPAGLGLYKSSEFTITPSVFSRKTESSYNGGYGEDKKSVFYLGNAGMVFASPLKSKRNEPGWRYVQFAMGVNRLQDFNNRMFMTGPNHSNSLLDTYVNYAEGPPQINYQDIERDPYYTYAYDLNLAWWTYLLDYEGDTINYIYTSPVPNGGVQQNKTVETKGSMNEYVFSFASNYNDRLYLGMTFAIPVIRYRESSTYRETDVADTIIDFKQFARVDYLETKGSGFNFKFGFIYRATDWLRFGASVQTPSWFNNMRDYWWASMESYYDNGDNYKQTSPAGNYNYRLTTPFRASGQLAIIFGQHGLISSSYEYVNYRDARLSAYDYNFDAENLNIRNSYNDAHHIRLGTEWRYDIFSFRGGFYYAGSPYQHNINDGARTSYSVGVGIRQNAFFVDLGYVYSRSETDYYYYLTDDVQPNPVSNLYKTHSILITLGGRF